MAKVDGKNIRLKLDTVLLFGVTSTEISLEKDMIETTTFESAGAKEYIAGEGGGTISATILTDEAGTSGGTYKDLFDSWKAGDVIAFIYGGTVTGDDIYSGNCIISSLSNNNTKNEASSANVTLQITGAITVGEVA